MMYGMNARCKPIDAMLTTKQNKTNRLEGSTAFINNYALWGGAIFNSKAENVWYPVDSYKMPVITYPEDTEFSGNNGEVSFDFVGVASHRNN